MHDRHEHEEHGAAAAALIALSAALALSPMFFLHFSCGNDLTFHMQSWMEAAQHWREGVLQPHWAASAAWGAGEPRFLFYPPLSWLLGAVLGLAFGWTAAPYAYCFAALVIAGASAYRLGRSVASQSAALLGAVLYVTNPYTLFVIYTRAALAELLAAALLPWLLMEALRPRIRFRTYALAVCCLWLANAPAAVIAMYALAVLGLARAAFERDWRLPLRQIGPVALGIALSGFYLVPAAYERRFVQIDRVISGAYDFHANFLFGGMGDPMHDTELRHVSWIAVALVCAGACGLVLGRMRARRPMAVLLVVSAVLLTPVTALLWAHLPQLRFLQFPWRWLTVAAVLYAVAAGAALARLPRGARLASVSLITAVSIGVCYASLRQSCDPEDTPAGIRAQYLSGHGFEATDEYEPLTADDDELRPDPDHPGYPRVWLYRADDAAPADGPPRKHIRMMAPVEYDTWQSEYRRFMVSPQRDAVAILQLRDYPNWRVTVDGSTQAKATPASSGQMQIPLAPGTHTVEIAWRRSWDQWAGLALSVMALLVLILPLPGGKEAHSRVVAR